MKVSTLPQAVQNAIEEHCGESLALYGDFEVGEIDPNILKLGDYILVPSHRHDIRESAVHQLYAENLTIVKAIVLMGGPTVTAYQKTDPAQDAWLVFHYECRKQPPFQVVKF